jgi:general stress protein 26
MESLEDKIQNLFAEKKICYIASTNNSFVDNAMVAYYSEGFTIYFGSFNNTLKCRNILANPHVAICIENIQIHGLARHIESSSEVYQVYKEKYISKFPSYEFYFGLEENELYKVEPLVIWHYDSKKGIMHRDKIVIDQQYYEALEPYEAPLKINRRVE